MIALDRPCPFCGAKTSTRDSARVRQTLVQTYYVSCWTCGAQGAQHESDTEAREHWNAVADVANAAAFAFVPGGTLEPLQEAVGVLNVLRRPDTGASAEDSAVDRALDEIEGVTWFTSSLDTAVARGKVRDSLIRLYRTAVNRAGSAASETVSSED